MEISVEELQKLTKEAYDRGFCEGRKVTPVIKPTFPDPSTFPNIPWRIGDPPWPYPYITWTDDHTTLK